MSTNFKSMKKRNLLVIGLLILVSSVFAKKDEVPEVVLIGIGAKNPSFNEAQYPHIKFYYTPDLSYKKQTGDGSKGAALLGAIADEVLVGTPEYFTTINAEHDLLKCYFLFDKNGVCYTQGYDITRRGDLMKATGPDDKALADAFKETIKKEKVAKPSKKEMKLKKSEFMIGYKLPDCKIVDAQGTEIGTKSITESGKPVLVLFFMLDSEIDIQAAKESGEGKSGGQFAHDIMSGAKGAELTGFCEKIEREFFEYDAREK